MLAAVHVFVKRSGGGGELKTTTRAALKAAVAQIVQRAGLTLDAVWLGKLINATLKQKCEYESCTIKHGDGALAEDGLGS